MNRQISIYDTNGPIVVFTFPVASGAAATIGQGVPTKVGTVGNIVPMVDADGSTSQRFTGVAKTISTDTAAAAGSVDVYAPLPGIIYAGAAKATTGANTQAKINALLYSRLVFDLTTALWTIDAAAGDGSTNCIVVVGGQYQTNTLYFVYRNTGTFIGA